MRCVKYSLSLFDYDYYYGCVTVRVTENFGKGSSSAFYTNKNLPSKVPTGSPSRGRDVTVYVYDINQPNLSTPFYSVLVSISVFMALSTAFHSINSPDSCQFSHSVPLVLSLPY